MAKRKSTLLSIKGNFLGKDIVSISQFDKESIDVLFDAVEIVKETGKRGLPLNLLSGKIISLMFYEPSSRTRNSFDAAAKQLNAQTLILEKETSSISKGESFEDTIKVFEAYCDALVIRHPEVGSVAYAAEIAENVPVINAGDGIGEHPTQGLLDLYTIKQEMGRIDDLHVVFFGELSRYRPVNSLTQLLSLYPKNRISFVSPKGFGAKQEIKTLLKSRGIKFTETENLDDVIGDADALYVTRVKKEFMTEKEYEKLKGKYVVDKKVLSKMKKKSIVMHALPRVDEIAVEVDSDPRAVYLRSQVRSGMYTRMALLALVLGKL